jgi:hypothetical protein
MSVRLTRFASLLAVTLAAVTLCAGGRVTSADAPARAVARRGPIEISTAPAPGRVAQAVEQERHDAETPERPLSRRLLLLAVVASVPPLASFARSRGASRAAASPRQVPLWLSRSGRSPPTLVTAIA